MKATLWLAEAPTAPARIRLAEESKDYVSRDAPLMKLTALAIWFSFKSGRRPPAPTPTNFNHFDECVAGIDVNVNLRRLRPVRSSTAPNRIHPRLSCRRRIHKCRSC